MRDPGTNTLMPWLALLYRVINARSCMLNLIASGFFSSGRLSFSPERLTRSPKSRSSVMSTLPSPLAMASICSSGDAAGIIRAYARGVVAKCCKEGDKARVRALIQQKSHGWA